MLRVITLNLNGIRAASRKGFFEWLAEQKADIVCLQETKAQMQTEHADLFCVPEYHCFYQDAVKKGYSGVGIYCRQAPDQVIRTLGWEVSDHEGRYLQVDIGNLSIVSIYLPSGSSGEQRQQIKFEFMQHYEKVLKKQIQSGRDIIICGDWNIVHKEIDIKNWKSNQKNSGCLPKERQWLDYVFDELGWVDAFRQVESAPEQYTWWSNRGRAWDNNVGWRIDYQIVTPSLANAVRSASIFKAQRFSDHAPLIMDYDY